MDRRAPDEFDQTLPQLDTDEKVCNRYKLIRELGRGGMGIVYLAHDASLDQRVALKVLPTPIACDKRAIARLKDEARRSLKLTHPNICRLYTFEQDDTRTGIACLVMQLVDGSTLDDLLAENPNGLPLERVAKWARQIASALDYAHEQGILHRDIKPSNIMVDVSDNALLMDFGIAREAKDTMTRVTGLDSSGTLPYMSPQQVDGENHKSNDIYSLAATLYEAIKGEAPFTTGDIYQQIKHRPILPIPNQPQHVNDALLAGMMKGQTQRPATATDLADALAGEPVAATRHRGQAARAPGRSHWWVAAVLAVVFIVFVIASAATLIWWAAGRSPSASPSSPPTAMRDPHGQASQPQHTTPEPVTEDMPEPVAEHAPEPVMEEPPPEIATRPVEDHQAPTRTTQQTAEERAQAAAQWASAMDRADEAVPGPEHQTRTPEPAETEADRAAREEETAARWASVMDRARETDRTSGERSQDRADDAKTAAAPPPDQEQITSQWSSVMEQARRSNRTSDAQTQPHDVVRVETEADTATRQARRAAVVAMWVKAIESRRAGR
ncbi:MAG: serine/threonine protein kinase [Phycisphaerales bacterium]|nr:serine/threonine protein kinase [Phycisphaerales bacterium]